MAKLSAPDNYSLAACIAFDSVEGYKAYAADATHLAFARAYFLANGNLDDRAGIQLVLE